MFFPWSKSHGLFNAAEALKTLVEVDPELHGIIEDEKRRQWCAGHWRAGRRGVRQAAAGPPGAGGGVA